MLEKRIKKLESELEIWKRCGCTLDSPLHEKLAAIEKLVPAFGVHAPCRVLGVLRSTYYHHTLRRPEQTVIEKEDEIFILGGALVYRQALRIADKMYITRVHGEFKDADTFFPVVNWDLWEEVERQEFPADAKHAYPYTFLTYVRKK